MEVLTTFKARFFFIEKKGKYLSNILIRLLLFNSLWDFLTSYK